MCQFCHQHGEGQRWYLNAANYAQDLVSDLRRQKVIRSFFDGGMERDLRRMPGELDRLRRAPGFVRRLVSRMVERRQQKEHYGQVVPLEEAERILDFMGTVVRLPCICRKALRDREDRFCLGITPDPKKHPFNGLIDRTFFNGPDTKGLERLDNGASRELLRDLDRQGLVHTVWTFVTPFIGGICNCDRADCGAMIATVNHGVRVMWRAEFVAQVDWDLCTGCRACLRQCQFGAMGFSVAQQKAFIDVAACYGCGACRAACTKGAISLAERAQVPVAADLW
jgi:ferredoxin